MNKQKNQLFAKLKKVEVMIKRKDIKYATCKEINQLTTQLYQCLDEVDIYQMRNDVNLDQLKKLREGIYECINTLKAHPVLDCI